MSKNPCFHEKDCAQFGMYDHCIREKTTPICCCHFIHEDRALPQWIKSKIEARIAFFKSDKHTWTKEMRDGALFAYQEMLNYQKEGSE